MVCQNKIKEIQYCNFSSDCFFKLSKYLAGTWQHGIQSAAEQTAKVDKLGEKWFCSGSRQLLSVFWRGQVVHLIAITLYAYYLPTRLSFLSLFSWRFCQVTTTFHCLSFLENCYEFSPFSEWLREGMFERGEDATLSLVCSVTACILLVSTFL